MKEIVKKYDNGEITVIWKPDMCMHSAKCFQGLPDVFDPRKRPWVNAQGATTESIKAQIDNCPSGALSYEKSGDSVISEIEKTYSDVIIEPLTNGPLAVHGTVTVKYTDGTSITRENRTTFCRCGASSNKPFCDGTHKKIGFEG